MLNTQIETFLPVKCTLGEGPVWSARENTLYWIDIVEGYFYRYPLLTKEIERFNLGMSVGCIGLRASGGLVLATKQGFALWQEGDTEMGFIAKPEEHLPDNRFNDGAVDPLGRFWAGSMNEKPNRDKGEGTLYRLDPDGKVTAIEPNLTIPNGIGWSPDRKAMYHTDSLRRLIYVYDFDEISGAVANRRVLIDLNDDNSEPDGMAVDSEGCLWINRWNGWRITRVSPAGEVLQEIPVPVQRPTHCAFGGDNLDQLFITCARINLSDEELEKQPQAGQVLIMRPGVQGQLPYLFRG